MQSVHYHATEVGISIIMSVRNAAYTIRDCIDSILSQSYCSYELLIGDEGSTDDTSEIISQYEDLRISYFRYEYSTAEVLNELLNKARGKYIVRMEADCVMSKYRLLIQYNYMQAHPDISAAGGSIKQYNRINKPPLHITDIDFVGECSLYPTTAIIRRTDMEKYNLYYDKSYASVADYALFCDMLRHELKLSNIAAVLVESSFETRKNAVNPEESRLRISLAEWVRRKEDEEKSDYRSAPVSGNKLSVCITFLNEGYEVGKTVREIRRTVGRSVDIVIVNDASDDGYDYEADLRGMGVYYVVNKRRIGAAAGKEKAVQISSTPYILLLDAHMRFYTTIWARIIEEEIEKTQHQLLCCMSEVLKKDEKGCVYDTQRINIHGAYIRFSYDNYIPKIKWRDTQMAIRLMNDEVPAILGACYCFTKDYWNKLKGLQGLIHYGCEEEYLSIKAWMEGGGCRLIKNVVIGHVYRKRPPYDIVGLQRLFNHIVILETLFPASERAWGLAVARKLNPSVYNRMGALLSVYRTSLHQLKDYYEITFLPNRFAFVKSINKTRRMEEISQIEYVKAEIQRLTNSRNEHLGLFYGRAGEILALALYARQNKDIALDRIMREYISNLECVESHCLPANLANGWAGIGWCLTFLIRNGLYEQLPEHLFETIDVRLMECTDFDTKNDFENGVGGILAYVVNRLSMRQSCFNEVYLQKLSAVAEEVLSDLSCDFRTYSYALQFLSCMKYDECEIIPPSIKCIIDCPSEKQLLSVGGLKGVIGRVLYLLEDNAKLI